MKAIRTPLVITGGLVVSLWSASSQTVLLRDTFNAATPNTTDLNVDLARQSGTLAPLSYTMAFGAGHYGHQLQNGNALDQLLVADFPNSTASLNANFNGANSAGGIVISFDLDSMPTVYGATPDNWGCVNLGMSAADQMANVNQGVTHFGILFRAAGTLQAFDGAAVVNPSPEPTYSTRPPGTTNHIELVITDADGNPFDGTGNTTIEVFVNGGGLPVWSFTKVGGYANNYINVQGSFRAHFDNLTVTRLPANRAPVIANPSFEADNFAVFPGYIDQNGPITGWNGLGGHGVNPGTFGGPFSDNGTIPNGTKAAFLQADGALSQVISGFSIGATYQIRYFENARNCCSGTSPFNEVRIGATTVVAAHAVPPVGGSNPYRDVTSDAFVATSTALELSFIKSNPQGGDTTLLVDNVSIITPNTPPTITAQPQDLVAALGEPAVFNVSAAGSAPLAYQWYFGNAPIVNATDRTLTVATGSATAAGNYFVIVANAAGSATSRVARLTLRAPVPGLFDTGVDDSRVALADGAVDPHWQLVVNADSASLEAIVENSQAFPIVAGPWLANSAGSKWIGPRFDTTAAAGLAMGEGKYVYQTTFDLTGLDRNSVVITGGWAIDNNGLSIRINGTPTGLVNNGGFGGLTPFTINSQNAAFVAGLNTLEFEVQNVDEVAGYTGLRVVGLRGLAELPGTPPSITTQPAGQLAATGESVTFQVVASGSSPLSYQWRKDGNAVSGATSPSYHIASVATTDAGDYRVVVSNPVGVVTSAVARLTVRNTIPGAFNTGVDDSKVALADGSVDPHYKLLVNPDGTGDSPLVEDSTVFPIVTGPWVANNDKSKWIGPRVETSGSAGGDATAGNYTYRTIVDLTGFDPGSVVVTGDWATDNAGLDILVNGHSTGQPNTVQFVGFTPFTLDRFWVAGPNEVDFVLNNSAVGYTGLRVDHIRALGTALPAGTLPFIVEQPQSVNATLTERVTFTVRANGTPPLQYQWFYGVDALPGETGSSLTFILDFPDQAGDYSVEVSSPLGTVHSTVAHLTLREAPAILTQPQGGFFAVGDTAVLTVTANGVEPLSYQWSKNGNPIPGATTPTLTLANLTSGDSGTYVVRVSNFAGAATSADAVVTVLDLIPGLFNTGVDATGLSLPSGSVDPHWTLTQSIDPAFPGPNAMVLNDVGFPIPPWLANDDLSKWIAPQADQSTGNLEGDYTYHTTFDLTGWDPASVRLSGEWASDNSGLDILINGTSTGQRNDAGFTSWTPFQVVTGFRNGINTLDVKINNAPSGVNPTGVRVQKLRVVGVRLPTNLCPVANSQTVTVAQDGQVNFQLGASDPDGNALQFSVSQPPTHGVLAVNTQTGAANYKPTAGYVGPDSFKFVATDGQCSSAEALVTITVLTANHCPNAVAAISPNLILSAGQTEVFAIADPCQNACLRFDGSQSTDADGDALVHVWLVDGAPPSAAAGVVVTNCLEIGSHRVTLIVDDGHCAKQAELVVNIITAGEAVEELTTKVNESSLARNRKRPLIASLRAATASFDRESWNSGEGQLRAFISKVRVLVAHQEFTEGEELIRLAEEILNQVNSNPDCAPPQSP
jgi:hypothetical protein